MQKKEEGGRERKYPIMACKRIQYQRGEYKLFDPTDGKERAYTSSVYFDRYRFQKGKHQIGPQSDVNNVI